MTAGKDQPALRRIGSQFGNNGDDLVGIARQTRLIQGITSGGTTGETHNPDRDLTRRDNEQGDRQELLNAVHGTTALPMQPKKSSLWRKKNLSCAS